MTGEGRATAADTTEAGPSEAGPSEAGASETGASETGASEVLAECALCRAPTEYPESHKGITLCPVCEWREAERAACSG
ncbi:hypothetical protein DEJ48_08480 [Streptomyces venezuelae]|uniref:Uncharacterized protein n=1 Tax=Streptomyces venezuelae TaxID=54571 RepID=A0A5P2BTV7_STRVZ|nr:hypothetical protein [Streptomyces venezuelae]QES33420.1 hypothetical protein DEJ48_08480 [Streptomyces venezuelae]